GGAERAWLVFALATGLVAIATALYLMRGVLAADTGTDKMREIAAAVQEGAEAFLRRQFKTIAIIVVPLFVLVFFTATKVVRPDGTVALTFVQSGFARAIAFLCGALFSGMTGFIGMSLSVRGNVRTAAAAREGKLPPALKVAFRTGGITGLLCVGLGLIGATTIVFIFQNSATAVLVGFGFGASLIALFMRVGGGIFTKAADVGADLVGKVEAGIPEDDPRNAATIADNVGDNVGDCAGMAADIFESYEVTIVAAMILGYASFGHKGVIFPLLVRAIGVIGSIISTSSVKAGDKGNVKEAMRAVNHGFWLGSAISVGGFVLLGLVYLWFSPWYVVNHAVERGLYKETEFQTAIKVDPMDVNAEEKILAGLTAKLPTAKEDEKPKIAAQIKETEKTIDDYRQKVVGKWKKLTSTEQEAIAGDKTSPMVTLAHPYAELSPGLDMRGEKGVRYYEGRPGRNGPRHGISSVKEELTIRP